MDSLQDNQGEKMTEPRTSDSTILIAALNVILVSDDTPESTKMLIRQTLFSYGFEPAEVTEGELRANGILEDRRQHAD